MTYKKCNGKGLENKGHWYRGNLHCHSTNSDGHLTPAQVVQSYAEAGYHFMASSDHDIYTDLRGELSMKNFLILPAVEASTVLVDSKTKKPIKVHHCNGILGTSQMQNQSTKPLLRHGDVIERKIYMDTWNGLAVAQDMVDALNSRGLFVTYNHPIWSRVLPSEFLELKGLWAFEIFNYGTELESNTGYGDTHWEMMLRENNQLFAFASDDNHNLPTLPDSFGGYVMVSAGALTHDAIVSELLAGNFYSSSGVTLYDFAVVSETVYVHCSPVASISFFCGNHINDGNTLFAQESPLTEGTYVLKGHETYIRVVCTDQYGKKAWSNPIWLQEDMDA